MTDSMIGKLIAILLVSIIIVIIKWGGAFLSIGWTKGRKKLLGMKYPLHTEEFPIKALKFGDEMEIKDLGMCKFQGKHNGNYYIESINGRFSNGLAYMYVDKEFLMSNCIALFTKQHIIKWQQLPSSI